MSFMSFLSVLGILFFALVAFYAAVMTDAVVHKAEEERPKTQYTPYRVQNMNYANMSAGSNVFSWRQEREIDALKERLITLVDSIDNAFDKLEELEKQYELLYKLVKQLYSDRDEDINKIADEINRLGDIAKENNQKETEK